MIKQLVCKAMIGEVQFKLYFKKVKGEGTGSFIISNDEVIIEIMADTPYSAQEVLLHELQEMYMLTKGMAYRQSGGILRDCSESRTFIFSHLQFREMIEEVFLTFSNCTDALTKAVKAK